MEHDEVSLTENFAGSNTDDDGIDSDLEDKLYAAVFHSNDVSRTSQAPGYDNFTTLTDVIGLWKNIPGDNLEPPSSIETHIDDANLIQCRNEESDPLRLAEAGRYETFPFKNKNYSERREPRAKETQDLDRTYIEPSVVQANQEVVTPQRKNTPDKQRESEKKLSRNRIIKKVKTAPKTSWSFKDLVTHDATPPKSPPKSDNGDKTDTRAGSHSANIVAPESLGNEPSEVKSEEEGERDQPVDRERRISLFDNPILVVEGLNEPANIKPEEEIEKVETAEKGLLNVEGEATGGVKPEEEAERVQLAGNEAVNSSGASSSSDSSFSSSTVKKPVEILRARKKQTEVIMIEDSEDSIFEIPVPPKPSPPTINLDDSESSTSSDSESEPDAGGMSPQKLVESYKMAVSESSRSLRDKGRSQATAGKKTGLSASSDSSNSSSSDSDDSMTESEEENWGILAGSQMNKDKASPVATEIVDEFETNDEPQGTSSSKIGDCDKSGNSVSKKSEARIESPKNTSIGGRQSVEVTRRSPSGETVSENVEMETKVESRRNVAEENTLIINAESSSSVPNFEEHREPETSSRTQENRKRSISDSGKKSKHHSPKKAKSLENTPASTSSSGHSRNNETKDKERNCAADYFFKPMTSEMKNYYNKSWGGENFDLDVIRKEMPRDPRHWAVLNEDLLGYQQRRSRYWTASKCRNCNRTGHHMADCPEKRKLPCCHMCGTQGHREPRCPHKMCLGCGKKQKTYMQVCNGCKRAWCNGCQSYGHIEDNCPDLWRRYHLTTSFRDVNTQLNVTDVMKPSHMLSCCNCARRGHDSTTCDNYRWSRHFPTPAFVTNYTTGPAYAEDVLQDANYSSEIREETERNWANNTGPCTSSSSNDGKRRKSNADNLEPEEILRTQTSREADKSIERPREQSKDPNRSQQKGLKSNEPAPTNLDSRKGGEILFKLKSPLVDAEFERAANFGKYTVPLTRAQCVGLVESDLSREFLLNLISQFPIKLEIKHCTDGNAKMIIRSTVDLYDPIQLTIMDWLKWPADERSRFVNLNLPTTKDELIKLLSEKLEELNQYLGDPMVLNNTVISLKSELKRLQRQSESGQKLSTCSKRARVVEELAKSQCKLNMILMGQTNVKSSKFLRITLSEMLKPGSSSYINATTYLQIVHHYNIVFAAYTAENVPSLLRNYFQKNNIKGVQKGKKDTVYNTFLKALNPLRKNSANSPTSAGSNGSPSFKARKQGAPKDTGTSDSPFNESSHYNRVKSRFQTPERGSDDPNPCYVPNLPLTETVPLMFDLDRLENNYYNSQYNFAENIGSRRHGGADKHRNQEDFIALDGRSLQNNHYNVEKDLSNVVVGDFNKRSKRRHRNRSVPRNGVNDPLENGSPNYQGRNIQRDSSSGRNKWHDDYVPRNISLRDIFLYDNQPERSSHPNFLRDRDERKNLSPWVDIDLRDRQDVNGPSTSTSTSTSVLNSNIFNNKSNSVTDGNDHFKINTKSKKKKRNKSVKLSPYLQKRAAKNIAKYIDLGVPRITQAAIELQKKVSEKQITLQCVQKFEGLVKRKLKRTDYLL